MREQTIYCVQPYWRDGMKLAHGDLRQFRTEGEARRAAERAYRRNAGVVVYSVTGSPEFDAWRQPRKVMSIGAVPPLNF